MMTTHLPHPLSLEFYLLLVIIGILALLIYVVFFFNRERDYPPKSDENEKKPPNPPKIIGSSQPLHRQRAPNTATHRQTEEPVKNAATFAREIPSEELNQVFGDEEPEQEDPDPDEEDNDVDLQDEESDLQAQRATIENDFATGVPFDELQKTTVLLQKEEWENEEQKTVLHVAATLSQTDLWEKIAEALPDANLRIAKLLDTSVRETLPAPTDWQSFDIRNFI